MLVLCWYHSYVQDCSKPASIKVSITAFWMGLPSFIYYHYLHFHPRLYPGTPAAKTKFSAQHEKECDFCAECSELLTKCCDGLDNFHPHDSTMTKRAVTNGVKGNPRL